MTLTYANKKAMRLCQNELTRSLIFMVACKGGCVGNSIIYPSLFKLKPRETVHSIFLQTERGCAVNFNYDTASYIINRDLFIYPYKP